MEWLAKFTRPKGLVGLEFGENYVGFAVRDSGDMVTHVSAMQSGDSSSEKDWPELVSTFVHKHHLQKRRCKLVIPASDCQMMLVERPDVPDDELRSAVKWRVKDLISAPIESVVVDIFALPPDANKAGKSMIYVVIADLARVKYFIDLVADAGLILETIDIEVLALRNLTLLRPDDRGAAVLRVRAGAGDVSIYRNGNLYLSRHFKLDFRGGLLDDLPEDALALEVQRSFDYVERQMGQTPPGVLYICGEGIGSEKVTPSLQRSLPCPIQFLDVSQDIGLDPESADESMLQLCMAAIGAVYRAESN